MIIHSTQLDGVYVVKVEPVTDTRGSFTNIYNVDDFNKEGLPLFIERCCTAYNKSTATWRGLHYQLPPYEEIKLVTCIKGGVLDIIVDIRPFSRTYKQWVGVGLSELNHDMVYIPAGCAHGYLTVVPNSELWYGLSAPYKPDLQMGIRYDDPEFGITLPCEPSIISEKDRNFPDFKG